MAWHGGKGSRTRNRTTDKEENDLREALWRADVTDKPAIRSKLDKVIAEKLKAKVINN